GGSSEHLSFQRLMQEVGDKWEDIACPEDYPIVIGLFVNVSAYRFLCFINRDLHAVWRLRSGIVIAPGHHFRLRQDICTSLLKCSGDCCGITNLEREPHRTADTPANFQLIDKHGLLLVE